ncbi:hypothetical protein [uncultured Erythrobacter sp.]|uniref:hypothetical protein n=1 Tax=uncultured Erythrobacter sp. TaxID=263913 RepID=UPI00261B6C37|nr:hypothetical protein [uncultured Erythrobacter sp.]
MPRTIVIGFGQIIAIASADAITAQLKIREKIARQFDGRRNSLSSSLEMQSDNFKLVAIVNSGLFDLGSI